MVLARVVLPEPDWPTSATISPAPHLEVHAGHRVGDAAGPEGHPQVLGAQHDLAGGGTSVGRPSGLVVAGAYRYTGSPTVGNAAARVLVCSCCGSAMTDADGPSSTS